MTETLDPVLPRDTQALADAVLDQAHDSDLKLTTAESCTGGLLAALLTDVRGRGHVFERGFVAYSLQAKCDLLGVEHALLQRYGAVSKPVALAMAHGALERSKADLAVSVTGFAGPGAPGDEEGLVHFGCVDARGQTAHREEHFGRIGRDGVRLAALKTSLEMLKVALDAR